MSLILKNPHSVFAALQTRPHDVVDVRLPAGKPSPAWADVVALAKQHDVPIRTNLAEEPPRAANNKQKSERTGMAQATIRERNGLLIEEIFADAPTDPGLQKSRANAGIQAYTFRHLRNIRSHLFRELPDLIDIADLESQKRIRGILDQLRRSQVG